MEPAIPISNLSLIETTPVSPAIPAPQYLPEPEHTWCYYYQKVDLARQIGDWDEAARLGDEALSKGLTPNTPTECRFLLKRLVTLKNWDQAIKLTENAYATNPSLRPALCDLWDRISLDPQTERGLKIKLICKRLRELWKTVGPGMIIWKLQPGISVVVPVYNSADTLHDLVSQLGDCSAQIGRKV